MSWLEAATHKLSFGTVRPRFAPLTQARAGVIVRTVACSRHKIFFRHALDVLRRDFQIAVEFGIHQIRILADHGGVCQRHGFFLIRVAAENESRNFLILGFLQFLGVDRLVFSPSRIATTAFSPSSGVCPGFMIA